MIKQDIQTPPTGENVGHVKLQIRSSPCFPDNFITQYSNPTKKAKAEPYLQNFCKKVAFWLSLIIAIGVVTGKFNQRLLNDVPLFFPRFLQCFQTGIMCFKVQAHFTQCAVLYLADIPGAAMEFFGNGRGRFILYDNFFYDSTFFPGKNLHGFQQGGFQERSVQFTVCRHFIAGEAL